MSVTNHPRTWWNWYNIASELPNFEVMYLVLTSCLGNIIIISIHTTNNQFEQIYRTYLVHRLDAMSLTQSRFLVKHNQNHLYYYMWRTQTNTKTNMADLLLLHLNFWHVLLPVDCFSNFFELSTDMIEIFGTLALLFITIYLTVLFPKCFNNS